MEEKVLKTYIPHITSLREVARLCNTDHHRVKRILKKHNILIVKGKLPKRKFRALSSKHKIAIGKSNTGKTMPKISLYKNMSSHLRFNITYKWLQKFTDIEKLKFLNKSITNRDGRYGDLSTYMYKMFIIKFYKDEQFNTIYRKWIKMGKHKLMKPSVDHIIPKSRNGTNKISNLQFLPWFENKCKCNMKQSEWNEIKNNISEYFT